MHFKISSPFPIRQVYEHPDRSNNLFVVDILGDDLISRKVITVTKKDKDGNEVEEQVEIEMIEKPEPKAETPKKK